MIAEILAISALVLSGLPAMLVVMNLLAYRRAQSGLVGRIPSISVLIPARDEERSIALAVRSVLGSRDVELELIVMDDDSSDRTAEIVRELAVADPRVRLESAPVLPGGWNGKQHACHELARQARYPLLVFLDADVRLKPDGLCTLADELERRDVDLLSGIPRQETVTLVEKLVIPLVHFVLLGFLPISRMRRSTSPSLAAGCGQLFVARRDAYLAAGGHAAIRDSRHDGLTLPRAFRRRGLRTDLVDVTHLAACRMYRSGREVWHGFAKNATEGMASPAAIGPWTVLLIGGQVLPVVLVATNLVAGWNPFVLGCATVAAFLAWATRFLLASRFQQSITGALLHPVGVLLVIAIQWFGLWRVLRGAAVAWKGRVQFGS